MTKKQQNSDKCAAEWRLREEKRINQKIDNFSTSFMSNTKWRKVLTSLNECSHLINCYRWKFVETQKIFETPVTEIRELDEKGLKDNGNSLVYREIEWLEVVTQNTKEITSELLKRGQFALDKTERGFKIIGYAL